MIPLIFSSIVFISWIIFIIRTYYAGSYGGPNHIETFLPQGASDAALAPHSSALMSYFLAIAVVYIFYKIWTLWLSPRTKISFGVVEILGFFLIHLAILCISFFSLPESGVTRGFASLFFGIVTYLIYPIVVILLTRTAGVTIISYFLPSWKAEDMRIRIGVEISLGFILFVTLLLIAGVLGVYNIWSLFAIAAIFILLSYPNYRDTLSVLGKKYFQTENHDFSHSFLRGLNPYLLSGEFIFYVLTFLISVSFISIYRPMPIGWDDLGVYMNFPKMMALNESTLAGAGYTAWQLITGTGFFFDKSAPQAFFLNQMGGMLSILMLIMSGSYFLSSPNKRYFIALPLFFATLWYALPMIVFQQAKDMKLDPALFFFSIAAVTALIGRWIYYISEESKTQYEKYIFTAIIGVLVGFAFTVKLTTIMLIIASLGFIAYRKLKLSGFFGFSFLFIALFTKLNFWKLMGLVLPDNPLAINNIVYGATLLSAIFFYLAYLGSSKAKLIHYIQYSIVFLLGMILPLIPWTIKHIGEVVGANQNLSVSTLINGFGGGTALDFTKIYTPEEIKAIELKGPLSMTEEGKSENEDMGRYFGYDDGINNYLRLPPNLTFQSNQPGEFTDITYIFLALLPVLFLFIRGKYRFYVPIVAVIIFGLYAYWFGIGESKNILSTIFARITLPWGYGVILAGALLFALGVHFLLEKNEQNRKIQNICVFLSLYLFLFVSVAFGIVWYGIVMYFGFILLIGLMSSSFVEYDEKEEEKEDALFYLKIALSTVFFCSISYYFIHSSLPHGWNNLKQSYYAEYKAGELTNEAAIFKYRSDYLDPIAYMNLKDPERAVQNAISLTKNEKILQLFTTQNIKRPSELFYVLSLLAGVQDISVQKDAENIGQSLYEQVLYPTTETENTGGIYRIGTFMTYFINKNRERYMDDSLIFQFNYYFYHPIPEVTVDRMKKLGIRFFLTDLNAATIDKDPRHNLTTRFENLLRTMPAKNLELISTDSQCLHIAIDDARKGLLSGDDYIDIAGVNYESYRTMSGQEIVVNRSEKRTKCYNYILKKMFVDNAVNDTDYSYLQDIKKYIEKENAMNDVSKLGAIMNNYIGQSWFALFRIVEDTSEDMTASGETLSGAVLEASTLSSSGLITP